METLSQCPVCDTVLSNNAVIGARDYLVSGKVFNIVQCSFCGFLLTNPRPSQEEIQNYYRSEAYISHTESRKSFHDYLYHVVRRMMLKRKIRLLKKHTASETIKILDYGCGTGCFLKAASLAGFRIVGFEPNLHAQNILKSKGINHFDNTTKLFKNNSETYDIITLWHVLEHIHEFPGILNKFYTLLKSRGLLVIAVPFANSADAAYYKEYWAAYDVPRHLYHFTTQTLLDVCSKNGFQLIDSKPLLFDSFYVSLLSEKNIKSHFPFINALIRGSISNCKAFFKQTAWSSEIFVFRKN
jgi:2-polyprenyl-3-methyl-5-hydroxy-6-metoxy-1,4-benzoquinol methylase